MSRNKQKQKQKQPPPPKSKLPLIIIAAVLVIAVVAGGMLVGSNRSGGSGGGPTQSNAPPRLNSSRGSVPPGAEPPRAKGPEGAPVMIEEFGDYQCPSCGVFNPVIKKIEADYGDRVRVVFRHMPLQMHRNASLAARAAEVAGLQGRFWEMHDLLYETQKEWSELPNPRPKFAEYAQRIGLDVQRFNSELDSREVGLRILADISRANSIGVNGTPTVFLNGYQVRDISEVGLRREIDEALAAGGGK